MAFYPNPVNVGLDAVQSLGEGHTINLRWFQAIPKVKTNKIAYNIYYATVKKNVFTEGAKFVSIDAALEVNITNLVPGQEYFFSIRPIEYDPAIYNPSVLPIAHDNLRYYPSSILRQDMSATDLSVPLLDVSGFPSVGVVKVGAELILYTAVDILNKNLIVAGGTSSQNASLVDQGGGNFYVPLSTNIGHGQINGLSLYNANAPAETWTIRCIWVQRDGYNAPIAGTAKFLAIGSISGVKVDGYGEPFVWTVNNTVVSNGILSFSIAETSPSFREGDGFTIKVTGAIIGTNGRGFNNSRIRSHAVSGYDGYFFRDPNVVLWIDGEDEMFDRIFACQSRFEYPNYAFNLVDGYHQVNKDLLSTDLTAADEANVDFPMYDFAGYHRTDPVQLLNGTCVGSYIGGEMGCIDKYGNFNIFRGFSLQDQNTQRQDVLLSVTGRPACLLKRVQTGITCSCYLPSSEYPDDRCPKCFGTKFVMGWEQYFNPRRSDGRILIRPEPTAENLRMREAGLESEFPVGFWTLTVPTIKTRDVLVVFDQNDNESFRYEVSDVIRNDTILGLDAAQHLKTFRVRKFDPIYQIPVFRNTAMFPTKINTSIGFAIGIPPHTHTISRNETDPSKWNQLTSLSQGHNHIVRFDPNTGKLTVIETLGHTHTIIV
jgi:hypothetical protein